MVGAEKPAPCARHHRRSTIDDHVVLLSVLTRPPGYRGSGSLRIGSPQNKPINPTIQQKELPRRSGIARVE